MSDRIETAEELVAWMHETERRQAAEVHAPPCPYSEPQPRSFEVADSPSPPCSCEPA